jgi:hypothetical protein
VVQAAGDGVAERSLSSLDVSLCSPPACSLGCAGRCRPQSAARLSDALLESVGLDALCGLVPGASRTRLLWEWSEREGQVGRGGRIEGRVPVVLAEDHEVGLDRGGARPRGLVLGILSPAVGKVGGKFSLALGGCR